MIFAFRFLVKEKTLLLLNNVLLNANVLRACSYAKSKNVDIIRPILYLFFYCSRSRGLRVPAGTWSRLPLPDKIVHIVLEFFLLEAVIGYHPGKQLPTIIKEGLQ